MSAVFARYLRKRETWNKLMALSPLRRLSRDVRIRYNEAVKFINALPIRNKRIWDAGCLTAMQGYLDRVSISHEELNALNIIHISGTKGKGSTGAFVESILHQHGFKTGFCSSPHLFEMRERFRVNQKPISKLDFVHHFEDSRRMLLADSKKDFPTWAFFCTLMAFHVFISEQVDVAIMEVGLGGAYDPSNVIKHPSVCGVSFLDYDHMEVLGNAIESIAWHKAGIFKSGAPAFTSPQSTPAMGVLGKQAVKSNVLLQVTPSLASYPTANGQPVVLGLAGDHQMNNASLALQLAESWMRRNRQRKKTIENQLQLQTAPEEAPSFVLTKTHLEGLAKCFWKGRGQTMKFKNLTFYLDGAHTVESMRCCADWFKDAASKEEEELGRECVRILAFNVTKNRDIEAFLKIFVSE